jgi:predicted adenylyl cyclase CyaB
MDFDLLRKHINALKKGESINKPIFSFKTGERDGFEQFDPSDVVIVEGLFALRSELQDVEDVKAFIDISLHGSMVRRLMRDLKRTKMDPAQILQYYLETVEPMYQEYVADTRQNADIVLINEYNPQNEAQGTGIYEAQTKFQTTLSDKDLRNAKAEFLEVVKQEDLYFSPTDKNLDESDESFRIRKEGGISVLSYKGPQMGKDVRVRPKFEFEIDHDTEEIFTQTYGTRIKEISKTRKLYKVGDAVICIDDVTKKIGDKLISLGEFVEVRCDFANYEEQLKVICERLNLNPDEKINTSYANM